MATNTYVPLANVTLGSTATSVTFSSISQSYKDLVLIINATSSPGLRGVQVQFNDDTGSNYNYVYAYGGDGGNFSGSSNTTAIPVGVIGSDFDNIGTVNLLDYSTTNKHKSALIHRATTSWGVDIVSGRWANTAAVTKIKLFTDGSLAFSSGSSFALYGIAG